jgi:hypothetical protein
MKEQMYIVKYSLWTVNESLADVQYSKEKVKKSLTQINLHLDSITSETKKDLDTLSAKITTRGRFTHSMPFPCRAHAVPLPCRAAKCLECVFPIWFTQCGRVWFTLAMPCHAMLRPCRSSQGHSTARPSRDGRAVSWPWEERHGQSMAWARHGKCESDKAALCKSNGKDTFQSLEIWHGRWTACARHGHGMLCVNQLKHGMAWHGNGMGAAWARHAMCESD